MKRLLFLLIFASVYFSAQELEDLQESFVNSEVTKNFFRIDVKKPFDYYKIKSCGDAEQFLRAQYKGGDDAYRKEIIKYIAIYVDKEVYAVNGTFYLNLDIDKTGKVTKVDIFPRVENSDLFLRDLKFAVKKIKNSWVPSKCNGIPINSRIRITLKFVTESADI